ncbi:pre-16S rRNA-processing nuclease YqgF [Geminocystis sp. GBBB08]|uniref:pre-16S rRNA-processing nuclease YqgF n=1 Tax=Geminocystis sp. GBBB08 TaxID=2604140 RepID=UPI0027E2B934|nr:pre-16S rRNA-processing nuclease YqgF [Geminocystis sp. GBBB08]MBL1208683.1 pre-16S rRNA-processing nuclease YqgF [Geminocystis sp. GBBB08]
MILGFDPGRDKCGLAILNNDKQILYNEVITSEDAITVITKLINKYKPLKLVMGNQTTSEQWKKHLKDNLNLSIDLVLVDEKNSTVEARKRYWEIYPPQGLTRLIPEGLRIPPRPVDDIVAIILIERYFLLKVA